MTKLPTFSNTHLIVNYLIRFEVALSRIQNTPLPKQHLKELQIQTEVAEIQNLSELIGSPILEYKAEQIQKGHVIPTGTSPLLVFGNYRSALDFARNYSSVNSIQPSTDLLLHLNKIVMKKLVEQWDSEKLREFSDNPIEIYDTWYKYRDYNPTIKPNEYFNSLFTWLHQESNTHRLLRLAVLVYELIDKAPLISGNQITTMAMMQALTKEYDFNPHMIFSCTRAVNYIATDLEKAFKQSKTNQDLTTFLEAFLYTFSLEMLNTEQKFLKTFDTKIKKGGKLREKFNSRQIKSLEYLEDVKKITREEYTKLTGVSFMTSYRDLKHLLDEGYLIQEGTGRGTFYMLKGDQPIAPEDKKPLIFRD
jgi:Fic family protein